MMKEGNTHTRIHAQSRGAGMNTSTSHRQSSLGAQAHQRRQLAGGPVAVYLVEVAAEQDGCRGDAHHNAADHDCIAQHGQGAAQGVRHLRAMHASLEQLAAVCC